MKTATLEGILAAIAAIVTLLCFIVTIDPTILPTAYKGIQIIWEGTPPLLNSREIVILALPFIGILLRRRLRR
ncbi:MAG: hypothetical protein AAF723_00655 [Pseudomonadota bacterium]